MAQDSPDTGAQRRLAEMDERLRVLQSALERDVGVRGTAEPSRPRRKRAPRIFPPPPPSEPSEPESDSARPDAEASRPVVEPPPPGAPPAPPAVTPPAPAAVPPQLEAMCARLLRATHELLAGYELALAHAAASPTGQSSVTLAAGPFPSVATLERFQEALRGLPEVAEVAVRGYQGTDRAILEVHLRE